MAYRDVEVRNERNRNRYRKAVLEQPFKTKAERLKAKAKQKNIPYDLDTDYLEQKWTGYCAISGLPINLHGPRVDPYHAELDRFTPSKGYTKGNVFWVSRKFNILKSNSTLDELELIIKFLKDNG
jgi:hypothetical protein